MTTTLLRRMHDFLERHRFTPIEHEPAPDTPQERRRWSAMMLAGWLTMGGAILAAGALIDSRLLLTELLVVIGAALPVAWRLHFSSLPRFWANWATFIAALVLGVIHWRMGVFTGGEDVPGLVLSYRALVSVFYWVMAFRSFAIRTTHDLTQTALPAASGLLLVLISTPTPTAIAGTALVLGGILTLLAGEHGADREEAADVHVSGDRARRRRWRPVVNSWIGLLVGAAIAATILAAVSARLEPSNQAGRWLRRQLAWRLAQLMIGDRQGPYEPGTTLRLGGPSPPPQDRLMLTVRSEVPLRTRTAVFDIYLGDRWERSERQWERLEEGDGRWRLPPLQRLGVAEAITEEYEVEIEFGYAYLNLLSVPWCPRELELDVPSVRVDRSGMVSFTGHLLPGGSYTARVASPAAVMPPPGTPRPPLVDMANALQLPATLPDRVRGLAREVVGEDYGDPTGMALSVENHLREEYRYDLEAPPLPEGRDYVDHFLFDSRVGYCNHYASAMVVLMRTLEVPARLVTGFTSGQYRPQREVYEVRDQDAHAWAEVFLPDTGWIGFDPTPPIGEETGEVEETGPWAGLTTRLRAAGRWTVAHLLELALVLAAIALIAVSATLLRRWYERRITPLRPGLSPEARIVHAYRQALRWLERDGIGRPPTSAPWEFAREVTRERPGVAQELALLTEKYVRARFSAASRSEDEANVAEAALARLRDVIFAQQPEEAAQPGA